MSLKGHISKEKVFNRPFLVRTSYMRLMAVLLIYFSWLKRGVRAFIQQTQNLNKSSMVKSAEILSAL